jgi:hypothetical protein
MFLFLLSPPISLYTQARPTNNYCHITVWTIAILQRHSREEDRSRHHNRQTNRANKRPHAKHVQKSVPIPIPPSPTQSPLTSSSTLPNPPHQPHQNPRQKTHQPSALLRGSTPTHVIHPPTQSRRRPNDGRSRSFACETQREQDGEVQAVRGRGRREAGTRGYLGWQERDGWTQLNDVRCD